MARRRAWSTDERRKVWERDKGRCVYCGGHAAVIDHVVPVKAGGVTGSNNAVLACNRCNYKKKGKVSGKSFNFIARGLYVLASHGESLKWIDNQLHTLEEPPPNVYATAVSVL